MAKAVNLEKLRKDTVSWPKVWAGFDSDIPIGEEIVRAMRLFLLAMVEDKLASATINRHMGNLWLLGGEIISWLHIDPELKDLGGEKLIFAVRRRGGPPLFQTHCDREGAKDLRRNLQEALSIPNAKA